MSEHGGIQQEPDRRENDHRGQQRDGSAPEELNQDTYGQGTGAGVVAVFLITARGTGGSESAVVYLQSTYGKRL